jgi:hypothetical protein
MGSQASLTYRSRYPGTEELAKHRRRLQRGLEASVLALEAVWDQGQARELKVPCVRGLHWSICDAGHLLEQRVAINTI